LEFHDPLRGGAPGYQSQGKWIQGWAQQADYRYRISLNKARNNLIEELVREGLKRGRKVVVLVNQRIHLSVLSKRLADTQHVAVSGEVRKEDRIDAMRRMDAGELNLILASQVFAKGVDIVSVDMLIDATALPNANNTMQRYGRGTRKGKGKGDLLYIDIQDRGKYSGASMARAKVLDKINAPKIRCVWGGCARTILNEVLS
jgi:superfamily II DNA or RNA helicase